MDDKERVEALTGNGGYNFVKFFLKEENPVVKENNGALYLFKGNEEVEDFARVYPDGKMELFLPGETLEVIYSPKEDGAIATVGDGDKLDYLMVFEDGNAKCYDPVTVYKSDSMARRIGYETENDVWANREELFGEPYSVVPIGDNVDLQFEFLRDFASDVKGHFPFYPQVKTDSLAGRGTYDFINNLTLGDLTDFKEDGKDIYLSNPENDDFVRISEGGQLDAFLPSNGLEFFWSSNGVSGFKVIVNIEKEGQDHFHLMFFNEKEVYFYGPEKIALMEEKKEHIDGSISSFNESGIFPDDIVAVNNDYTSRLNAITDYVSSLQNTYNNNSTTK